MAWFLQKDALSESTNESEKCVKHLDVLEKSQSLHFKCEKQQ